MKIQKSDSEIMEEYGMAELPLILYKLYKKYNANYELIDIGGNKCCKCFLFGNIR